MTKLHRPCTLWGQTFDACTTKGVVVVENENGFVCFVQLKLGELLYNIPHIPIANESDVPCAVHEAITTIAQALNAPVKATQAVLDAMEKMPDAKFFIDYGDRKEKVHDWHFALFDIDNEEGDSFIPMIGERVIADCPLALQVLLQFTIEGERI